MLRRFTLIFAAALTAVAAPALADSPDSAQNRILKRDFNRMMEWFPGRYDNQEQVYFQEEMDVAEELRHGRIHHIFAPVKLEGFPGTTFYVQQYQNDDPSDIYRQRIYSFEPDFDENAIRLTIYIPNDASSLVDIHEDPDRLAELTPDDFYTYPGCEVFWRYQNEFYHGFMKERACQVESRRSGKTLIITDDLQLSKESIWIRDEGEDSEGNYIYGHKGGEHHKNYKARNFKCWVSPKKNDGSYGFYPNVRLHDQGGRVWLESEDHERVGLKMRNVVWPYGNNRASMVLYAYRGDDEDRAVSYAWTGYDGDRIGINLRWMQASCTLDKNGFFDAE